MSMGVQRGPQTRPRATYTKIGLGQVKQVRGNPVSWRIDCMGNCWPFLTLRGGRDEASQTLRTATAQNLRPRQTVLQSRGVLGVVERADGGGGAKQPFNVGPTAQTVSAPAITPDPALAPSTTSSDAGTPAPTQPCGDGLVYVPLAGGRFKCAVPWGIF